MHIKNQSKYNDMKSNDICFLSHHNDDYYNDRGDVYVLRYGKKYILYSSMDDDTLLEVHNSDAHTLQEV